MINRLTVVDGQFRVLGGAVGVKQMDVSIEHGNYSYDINIQSYLELNPQVAAQNSWKPIAARGWSVGRQCPVSSRWDVPQKTISHERMQTIDLVMFGRWFPLSHATWQVMEFMGVDLACVEFSLHLHYSLSGMRRRCKGQRRDS